MKTFMYVSIYAFLFSVFIFVAPVQAGQIEYLSDPVYEPYAENIPHPLDDFKALAEEGDARAQFILGDLYSKGKGGLEKDVEAATSWFEKSAKQGYVHSMIRLAALARRAENPVEVYKWYSVALKADPDQETKDYLTGAREKLVDKAGLTKDNIKDAEKSARKWARSKLRRSKERQYHND